MNKIGFIVNPIAGMGGKVGLKGTDGKLEEAKKLGATPIANERAKQFFKYLRKTIPKSEQEQISFIVAPQKMGEQAISGIWSHYQVIEYNLPSKTTAQDTIQIAQLIIEREIELLIFVGGDGTSNDVFSAVNKKVPILGVPSGVKIFGAVFAKTPQDAAQTLKHFISTQDTHEAEVMDIDEQAYRNGDLSAELKGLATVPLSPENMQSSKHGSPHTEDEKSSQQAIARFVIEKYMKKDVSFILGPGTTVKAITDELNLEKTPLGIDIVQNKKLIAKDVNENQILDIISDESDVKIIITPLGHQGALFGRGNQQISGKIIGQVGKDNIIVIATKNKLGSLAEQKLYVDTYDEEVNDLLRGFIRVITDYRETTMVKVV